MPMGDFHSVEKEDKITLTRHSWSLKAWVLGSITTWSHSGSWLHPTQPWFPHLEMWVLDCQMILFQKVCNSVNSQSELFGWDDHVIQQEYFLAFKKFFSWSIFDLQCCVSFRCIAESVLNIYMCVYVFRFFSHIGHYRVLNRVPIP